MANTKKYISLDKLSVYDEKIKGVITSGDAAALQSAKDYADSLSGQYDAAGSAATAETNAKTYADTEIGKVNTSIAGVKTIAEQGVADAATADGKAVAAQAAADKAQDEVDALETYVGTFTTDDENVKTVVQYIDKKTEGIATDTALAQLQGKVTTAEQDIDKLEGLVGTTAVATQISTAVQAETDRATGVEEGFETRIAAIEGDYLKAADKTALQEQITTNANAIQTLTDGVDAEKVDGVKDLINYVEEHGAEVTGMKDDISANATAISEEVTRATGVEAGLQTAVEKAQADATKANTDLATAIETLEGADDALSGRIAILEGKFGGADGSVEDQIADAQTAAVAAAKEYTDTQDGVTLASAKSYTDTEIDKVEGTIATLTDTVGTKAAQADLTALAGRVTTNETNISTLKTEMDAVETLAAANKAAHEANAKAIELKADKTALDAVSGRVTTLENWHSSFTEVSEDEINQLFQ